MARKEKTVDDLIAELDSQSSGGGVRQQPYSLTGQARSPGGSKSGFGGRLLLALTILTLGFGIGWICASLRPKSSGDAVVNSGRETRQNLLADGWQETDQGVFTRRCQDNCRRPVLYGGGVADVMEVNCLERPCGDIRADFAVLDARGQVIDQIKEERPGRQGERLQIVLESQLPDAHRFVLKSFNAKARLD